MSKLDELIAELCPDGVEWKNLQEVCGVITTGKLNANAMTEDGEYPFFTCDKDVFKIDTYAFDGEAILISGNGSQVGHINYCNGKFNAYQRTYVLMNINDVSYGFLLHWLHGYLKPYILRNCKKGSVPYITLPMLQEFDFPVPPIEVQNEIVRILDSFTELEEELEEELEARRRQYEYYRDSLLTFDDKSILKPLGDFATITRGGSFQKKDFVESGLPCIHYGQMYTHFRTYTDKTLTYLKEDVFKKSRIAQPNDIVMAVTSENVEDVCSCVAWIGTEPIAVSGHTAIIHHNQNAKYLAYYFQTAAFFKQKQKLAHGTKVIEVTPDKLADIKIPIPSLEKQKEIVEILDHFEALCNDISSGLPAEIEARHKQYEYYRDKLLAFKRKAGVAGGV